MLGRRVEYVTIDEVVSMPDGIPNTEALLALPLEQRVEKCLELGMRTVPVARGEKTVIADELDKRRQPGLVVYKDRPVERPMTHEALAQLAKPHAPREGEVTADHVAAWLKEKS